MNNPEDVEQLSVKIILLGSSTVGKSSILVRYIKNSFYSSYLSTVGIDFGKKTIEVALPNNKTEKIEIHIWDTAGQERFGSIVRQYYNKSNGAFVIFDLSDKKTLADAEKWINQIYEHAGKKVHIFLVGNKSDITERQVTEKDALDKANEHNIKYFEVSAFTGKGVTETFEEMAKDLLKKYHDKKESLKNKEKQLSQTKERKKCCN